MPTIDLTGIRAIFFDAVGTLLYPVEPVATTYRKIAGRHGPSIDEATIRERFHTAFVKQEQIDRHADWRTSEAREVERWRSVVRETLREVAHPDDCFFELWEWFRNPSAWTTHAETASVLTELQRRGFTLGMASNFDARLAEIVAAKPELEPLAERLVVSSLAGWRKPAKEFYTQVIAVAEHATEQILHIGDDRRNDYDGAIAAGMRAMLLAPGSTGDGYNTLETLSQLL